MSYVATEQDGGLLTESGLYLTIDDEVFTGVINNAVHDQSPVYTMLGGYSLIVED